MHVQQRGKNSAIFVFIFLLLGLITANILFYIAGTVIAFAVFFDLISFLVSIDTIESSVIRKISKNKLFQDNLLHVEIGLKLKAKNLKNVYFRDIYPDAFALISGDAVKKIQPGESYHSISYSLSAIKCGTYSFSQSHLHLESNFRMFKHRMSLETNAEVSIYPPVLSKKSIVAHYISSMYGSGKSKQKGMGIDVADIRNYMHGDDLRHIDWKTSLRLNSMFTKEFESDTGLPIFVLVDHSKSDNSVTGLDYAIRIANYLTQQAATSNQPVGLITFTHDRITSQAVIKKGKKQFEILKNLITLQPAEGKSCNVAMDIGEIKEIERKLNSYGKDEFYSILAPFFVDNSEHSKIMETLGIHQAMKHVINFSRAPAIIAIITDLVYDAPLIESIRLAVYYGNKVILIVTSAVLFRAFDVFELEEHYQEYMKLERKIEKFKRLKGIKVVEACPYDKPELLINQAVYRWRTRY